MEQIQTKKAAPWILAWAGTHKKEYLFSVFFAVCGVILRLLPYFVIGDVVCRLSKGERDLVSFARRVLLIALLFAAGEIFHGLSTTLSHRATFHILGALRKACLEKLCRVPLGYVKNRSSGDLKNVLVERIDSIETTLAHIIPEFTANLIAPIVVLFYLFSIDWRMGILSMVPVGSGVLCAMGMFRGYEENYKNTVEKTRVLNAAAVEYINGIEVIKAFGKADASYQKFTVAAREGADAFIHWMQKCIGYHAVAMTLTPYTFLTVLPFGAFFVKNGSLSFEDFILCAILSLGIVGPIIVLMSFTDDLGVVGTIVGEVTEILSAEEMHRPEKSLSLPADDSVRMEAVRFGYGEREVLHGISLFLPAGTVNALVGPSGSGKSTVAKLLASLWDPDSGSILIGGVDIRDISAKDYNRLVAYVSQDDYLFNQSVMENIRLGRAGASDEEVMEAAKRSGCYDFIMGLENGFHTVAGGSGGHLSGGERQRISIARAMLKDAPVVILDEATAYTDPENEALVQKSVAKLVEGKTLLVIAHRLSTVRDANRIFVISEGKVAEEGRHEALLAQNGIYKKMWEAHMSSRDRARGGEEAHD